MAISLNTAFIQPSATQLAQSSQTLTAQPLTDDQKDALVNANPAAVYHPSDETPASSPPIVAIETWIGRLQSPDFPQVAARHQDAHQSLKSSFEDFKSSLADTFPELADKKFGFTVNADGSLKAIDSSGQLTAADMSQLNKLLNASDDLKSAASNYRDASIDLVNADSPWGGSYLGGYNLTKDNFANTIDLGALFTPKGSLPTPETLAGFFSQQLWSKGERATQETEATMLAARDANKIVETA